MNFDLIRDQVVRLLGADSELELSHFKRILTLDAFRNTEAARTTPPSIANTLLEASNSEPAALLERLKSHDDGLTETESEEVLERVGPNEVQAEKPMPWWVHLWHCYANPFSLLLSVLAIVSYFQ